MSRRMLGALLAAAALCAAGTGCSKTIAGIPARAAVAVNPDGVDIAALDTGNYPTKPRAALGPAADDVFAAVLEGHRLAAHVLLPTAVDPALKSSVAMSTTTLYAGHTLIAILPKPAPDIATAHHLVTGFSTARQTDDQAKVLINAVLLFPDPESAAAAAAEFAAALQLPDQTGPMPIPRYPDALGAGYDQPAVDGTVKHTVDSYLTHGRYLLYQWATSPEDPQVAAGLIAATLDQQIPLIDAFTPTDPAKLKDLPKDPLGLLNRVLPGDSNDPRTSDWGDFDPTAVLHFQTDPVADAGYFRDTRVDGVARLRTQVYRAGDPAGATTLLEKFTAQVAGKAGAKPAAGVPGLPVARCYEFPATNPLALRFGCLGRADRYVFEAWAQQERDVHQQLAAQYLMLTG